ncbi:HAD-superfamily phosphatase [Dentipellis sp. KUC8613]|nr:HAD-superfamily phosphatase [Dentipellis sp. KUC8613]
MPFNLPGTLVPFYALFNPRLLLPAVSVADIRQLDFAALRRAGYRGAVFDKDNCLTIPHNDDLVPELQDAWQECRQTFGKDNVLIVSNSAGTHLDPGGLQAESVSYNLGVPVLFHKTMKPSYGCARSTLSYFASLPRPLSPHELVIIGDRIFTDVVLSKRIGQPTSIWQRIASRIRLSKSGPPPPLPAAEDEKALVKVGGEPLAVWTTGVWKREGMAMRWGETKLVQAMESWMPDAAERRSFLETQFVKPPVEVKEEELPKTRLRRVLGAVGWTVGKLRALRRS